MKMTDKEEIIIDGVDVSECEFYSSNSGNCLEFNGKYTIDICDSAKCSNDPNCYYKQLQRKEQECEKFKKENEKYKSFLEWMLKQQYYILPANIKKKIKEVLNDNNINLN